MKRSTWREEYRLGRWRSIVGHRRLEHWRRLMDHIDESHLIGLLSLIAAVLMIVFITSLLSF